jgi:translation elongation factor EF-Tu-like GTPase
MVVLDIFEIDRKVMVTGQITSGSISLFGTKEFHSTSPIVNFRLDTMFMGRKMVDYAEAGEMVTLGIRKAYAEEFVKGQVIIEAPGA